MSPPKHFLADQFRSYLEEFGEESFKAALELVGIDSEPGEEDEDVSSDADYVMLTM